MLESPPLLELTAYIEADTPFIFRAMIQGGEKKDFCVFIQASIFQNAPSDSEPFIGGQG